MCQDGGTYSNLTLCPEFGAYETTVDLQQGSDTTRNSHRQPQWDTVLNIHEDLHVLATVSI
jgi:hypothetical protein